MASVAICPHCYLQLVVPDGVESDERVMCPTCAKEFSLNEAVLRAIPEVVRCPQTAGPIGEVEETVAIEGLVDEVAEAIEIDEIDIEIGDDREPSVIEEIKARIEAGIAAHGLHPGMESMLPLGLPADGTSESLADLEHSGDDIAAAFRHAKTLPELPLIGDLDQVESDATSPSVDEIGGVEEFTKVDDPTVVEDDGAIEAMAVPTETQSVPATEPVVSPPTKPTVRTPANLMSPEQKLEFDEAPGPSFDLPNVPLRPSNGATVEIDPSMSFGPAAETEFELDDIDFESMPPDELVADDPTTDDLAAEESSDVSEPVFSEPEVATIPAAPFVLPGITRSKKKRSVVRMLTGTVLGGVVGTIAAGYILLFLLGPDGDLLHVAKYLPSAVLPKSFDQAPKQVADVAPLATEQVAGKPAEENESATVPASYAEDAKAPIGPAALDKPSDDDRYGTEPSPLEEPAAEPIADNAPRAAVTPPRLRGPTFTVEQLAIALEAGNAAQAGLMTGNLSDESVRRTKGMSYAKLCDLAEALTFVDRSSPSIESEDAIDGADRLFRETLADAHTRNEIARIVPIWIESPHREHGGIFLTGRASGGQIEGEIYEYELASDDGEKLTLLTPEPLDPSAVDSSHPIGIVGSIVENPAEEILGYSGRAERAIWVGRAIPLD